MDASSRGWICADCGTSDPLWASISRGILICNECCQVHRSFGRHISQVKCLKKSIWYPSQLQMVRTLYSSGANSIWEHNIIESSTKTRKKPSPKDPLYPTKADFIRAKHQNLVFINRPSKTNDDSDSDISEQLHSSVRTSNLKTSLRLLVAGANPNYIHHEKGNSPLHVAAKSNQLSQIELLLCWGGDPIVRDIHGKTPAENAKQFNHSDIAQRLLEAQYELTDRLSYFLCGRKPDHQNKQNYLIPEICDSVDSSDIAKDAKFKLQSLSNRLFEQLCKDIYDEVDRRETDEIWLSMNQSSLLNERQLVPFLPVNSVFTSTRNQGRQKLALFNLREFTTLIIHILIEARRRQQGIDYANKRSLNKSVSKNLISSDSDSEPLYDSVASDGEDDTKKEDVKSNINLNGSSKNEVKQDIISQNVNEYGILKDQLTRSDVMIQELVLSNKDMRHEITRLQIMVQKLIDENAQLRAVVIPKDNYTSTIKAKDNSSSGPPPAVLPRSPNKELSRPKSMYEHRSPSVPYRAPPALPSSLHWSHDDSGIENFSASSSTETKTRGPVKTVSADAISTKSAFPTEPSKEDIFKQTEQITKKIQDLLQSAQEGKLETFVTCSGNIKKTVEEMINMFTVDEFTRRWRSDVCVALAHLKDSALRLETECSISGKLQLTKSEDHHYLTQQVIQCAYDIAKAAKQLVTIFQ